MGSYVLDNKEDYKDLLNHLKNCKGDDNTIVITMSRNTIANLSNLINTLSKQSEEDVADLLDELAEANDIEEGLLEKAVSFNFDLWDIESSISFGENRCSCCGEPLIPENATIH